MDQPDGFVRSLGKWRVLALAAVAFSAGLNSAQPVPAKAPYDIESAADVDQAVAMIFGPRQPPIDTRALGAHWKAIVADSTRPPIKIIFDPDRFCFRRS